MLLIIGIVQGTNAMNTVNQLYGQFLGDYANQLKGTLFWNAAQVYIVSSLVCFAVGGVGVIAGRNQTAGGEIITLSHPPSMVTNVSQIQCGSCGTMNDLDAIYCKKCGSQFKNEASIDKVETSWDTSEETAWDMTIKKCSNCGANYLRSKEKCPFCGKS
jgi:ribosomal protein L40E